MPDTFWEGVEDGIQYQGGTVHITGTEEEAGDTLGPELITNGTFTDNADGWTFPSDDDNSTVYYNDNNITAFYTEDSGTNGDTPTISQEIEVEEGRTYQLSFDISDATDTIVSYFEDIFDNDSEDCFNAHGTLICPRISFDDLGDGHHTFTFTSDHTGSATFYIESYNWYYDTGWTVDNVSVREVVSEAVGSPIFNVGSSSIASLFSVAGKGVYIGAAADSSLWTDVGRARVNIFAGAMTASGGAGGGHTYELADGISVSFDASTGHGGADSWAFVCSSGGVCAQSTDRPNLLDDATFLGTFTGDASPYDAGIYFMVSISDVGNPDSFYWEERGISGCMGKDGGDCIVNDLLASGGPISLGSGGSSSDISTPRTLAIVDDNASDLFVVSNNGSFTLGSITTSDHGMSHSSPIISYDTENGDFDIPPVMIDAPLRLNYGIIDSTDSLGGPNQVLTTDGSGNLVWADGGGSGAINYVDTSYVGITSGPAGDGSDGSLMGNTFIGNEVAQDAVDICYSAFIGSRRTGRGANGVCNSIFMGGSTGENSSNIENSIFIGSGAGQGASGANDSIFIGHSAGKDLTDSGRNIIIGSNITLPEGSIKSINIGGILFGNEPGLIATPDYNNPNPNPLTFGRIGIATIPTTYTLEVGNSYLDSVAVASFQNDDGTCYINPSVVGGIDCPSDQQLKKDITDLPSVLDTLSQVRTVNYHWNKDTSSDPLHTGFIAQDINEYFPELVSLYPSGYYAVNYAGMTPILTKAIQEINANITDISDLTRENTWRDALVEWFADAANGITDFFADRVTTDELCVRDDEGQTCLTRSQIEQILGSGVTDDEEGGESADETETETPEEEPEQLPETEPEPPAQPTTPQVPEEGSSTPEEAPDAPADTPAALQGEGA